MDHWKPHKNLREKTLPHNSTIANDQTIRTEVTTKDASPDDEDLSVQDEMADYFAALARDSQDTINEFGESAYASELSSSRKRQAASTSSSSSLSDKPRRKKVTFLSNDQTSAVSSPTTSSLGLGQMESEKFALTSDDDTTETETEETKSETMIPISCDNGNNSTPSRPDQILEPLIGETARSFIVRALPTTTSSAQYERIKVYDLTKPSSITHDDRQEENRAKFLDRASPILVEFSKQRDLHHARLSFEREDNRINDLVNNDGYCGRTSSSLIMAAIYANYVSGKWFVCVKIADVDKAWKLAVKNTMKGRLGYAASVKPVSLEMHTKADRQVAICIHVPDMTITANLQRIGRSIRRVGLLDFGNDSRFFFKPDAFTALGISAGNIYGFPPTLFSSNICWDKETDSEGE